VHLCAGACPKSYGTNVARLAGLPAGVVSRAAQISAATEGEVKSATAAGAAGVKRKAVPLAAKGSGASTGTRLPAAVASALFAAVATARSCCAAADSSSGVAESEAIPTWSQQFAEARKAARRALPALD
jgi:DNA mismatch repair ATPase MutS